MADITNDYYASASSGWDYSTNVRGEPDGTYAREKNTASQTKYLTCSGFNINDIPEGAVISKVELESKVYSSSSTCSVGIIARINGTDQGSYVSTGATWPTVITKTYTSGDLLVAANLAEGVFSVRVKGVLPKGGGTNYADYLKVSVTYSIPVGLEMGCNF